MGMAAERREEIVIDKSWLDGASTQAVRELCGARVVLFSEELFFELMTTSARSQKRCFSKLPEGPDPIVLLPNAGKLLRFERDWLKACGRLGQHRDDEVPFQFHAGLRDGSYELGEQLADTLSQWQAQVRDDTEGFIERCHIVHQFFPEMETLTYKDLPHAVAKARQKVGSDADFVRAVYDSFLDKPEDTDGPPAHRIGPDWLWFRWVQCQILSSLRIFERHQGMMPAQVGKDFWRRAEHSMLDSYYVMMAAIAGGLASFDGEVMDDFVAATGAALWAPKSRGIATADRNLVLPMLG
jgi:hypothetical protein